MANDEIVVVGTVSGCYQHTILRSKILSCQFAAFHFRQIVSPHWWKSRYVRVVVSDICSPCKQSLQKNK